jgi:glycosyltransferase involved in cell wall biosynthesis
MSGVAAPVLLSVIIPNHNYGQFIGETIASLVRQDYAALEVVIVDDASSDDSVKIIKDEIEAYKGKLDISLIEMKENKGKVAAVNRAMEVVKGEYCLLLDSDDYLMDNHIVRCLAVLERARTEDEHVGFVYMDCHLISADGEFLERGRSAPFDAELIRTLSYIPEPALVVMEAMKQVAPFDESVRKGTKQDKWCRIIGNGWTGIYIPEALFCYRMHDNNLSGIGARVQKEVENGKTGERILSGYWPVASRKKTG